MYMIHFFKNVIIITGIEQIKGIINRTQGDFIDLEGPHGH